MIEKVEFLNCIGCRGRLVSGRTLKKASGASAPVGGSDKVQLKSDAWWTTGEQWPFRAVAQTDSLIAHLFGARVIVY